MLNILTHHILVPSVYSMVLILMQSTGLGQSVTFVVKGIVYENLSVRSNYACCTNRFKTHILRSSTTTYCFDIKTVLLQIKACFKIPLFQTLVYIKIFSLLDHCYAMN